MRYEPNVVFLKKVSGNPGLQGKTGGKLARWYVWRAYIKYVATATAGNRSVKVVLTDGTSELKLASNVTVAENGIGEVILTRPFWIANKFYLLVDDENGIDATDSVTIVLLIQPYIGERDDSASL